MELNLRSVDLNLLPVFEAAYEERSLSRAARRLAMTQPAVSHALQRLRLIFRDELFIRHSRGMTPTPAAEAVYARLHGALDRVREVVTEAASFDPALTPRRFFLSIPHPLGPTIALRLLDSFAIRAPHLQLEFSTRSRPVDQERKMRDGQVDLAIDWLLPEDASFCTEVLFEDQLVVIARGTHPVFSGPQTLETLRSGSFVTLRARTDEIERIPSYRRWHELKLRHVLEVSELLEILLVVAQSDLYGIMPESLVRTAGQAFGVRRIEVPGWGGERLPVRMIWHPRRANDAAHVYLRGQLADIVQTALAA